jgi:hypothetical protein
VHTSNNSNAKAWYDLPPPHDIPEEDRKWLDPFRETLLLSFTACLHEFLGRFQHYFPKTFDKDCRGLHSNEVEMEKAIELERDRDERWPINAAL